MPETDRHYRVLARLRPAVDAGEAAARISALGAHMEFAHGETGLAVLPARTAIVPDEFDRYGRMFGVAIVALSGLVLLIACSNLTNLLLARTASRSIEIAVRMAAGANRWRIAALLLTETAVVTVLAAGGGLALAFGISTLLAALPLPELDAITIRYVPSLDLRVFAYSIGSAVLVTVAVGMAPAWRATRTDPVRTFAHAGGASPRSGRLRNILIGVQMAACTVLLLAAGLFIRSTLAGLAYDPGFDITHTASADVNLSYDGYDEIRGRAYFQRLLDDAMRAPGIVTAALASDVPAGAHSLNVELLAEGEAPISGSGYGASGHGCSTLRVTPGLFSTIRERLISGRDFNADDTGTSRAVAIVNESVAKLLWPGQNPIGRRLSIDKDRHLLEVVGLVADTDRTSTSASIRRFVFVPWAQNYSPRMSIVARGPADGAAVRDPLRTAARQADPDVAVTGVRTLAERVAIWLIPLRYAAMILLTLGVLGAFIALIGVYGVTAYLVTLRTREFGILKALGATGLDIYRSVLTQGARTLIAGVAVGLGAAFLAANLLQHLLYDVHPHDVTTFIMVPAALVAVGLLASFVPARRRGRTASRRSS
jgi:predicted permease